MDGKVDNSLFKTIIYNMSVLDIIFFIHNAAIYLYLIYQLWEWLIKAAIPGLSYKKEEYFTTCSDFGVIIGLTQDALRNPLLDQTLQTVPIKGFRSPTTTKADALSANVSTEWYPVVTS